MELLDYIKQIQLITPKPGDILMVTLDGNVSERICDEVGQALVNSLNERGHKEVSVLVYNGNVKIEAIRKEE